MEITGATKVMFVLAHPVDHVRAPSILNAHFKKTGADIATVPLNVHPEDLAGVLDSIRRLQNVIGFGVTIPHKVPALALVDQATSRARNVGAVNFVKRTQDGQLIGDNMDGIGFVSGLRRMGIELEGKSVLQIGAGGAGRATAFAMAEAGVSRLGIKNRDQSKARDLAERVTSITGCRTDEDIAAPTEYDIVVNATSLGMKDSDPMPVDPGLLRKGTVLADIVMAPPVTKLMSHAGDLGCTVIGGKIMLDEQMELVTEFLTS